MKNYENFEIVKSPRIPKLIEHLYAKLPEIEADRAVILTESYKETEGEPRDINRNGTQHIYSG
jgi:hypothetical protein